ncbi:MAG: tetratricopeptide repeat protein [Bacteroidota bacterium]
MTQSAKELENNIKNPKSEEHKIDSINELAWMKRRNDIDNSFKLAKEAYQLSEEIDYKKGIAYSKFCLAFHDYTSQGNITRSIQTFLEVIDMFIKLEDDYGRGMAHSLVSFVYWTTADYENGFHHLLEGEVYQEKSGNKEGMAWDKFNFGTYYSELNNFDEALPYFEEALNLFRDMDESFGQASTINGLANIYKSKEEYGMAISYCEKSISLSEENGYSDSKASALRILGETYEKMEDFDIAIEKIEESLEIYQEIGDKTGIVGTKLDLGVFYCDLGDGDAALKYLQEVEKDADEAEAYSNLITANEHLASIYEAKGDKATALEHFKKYVKYKEMVMGDASANQVQKMQAIFNVKQARQETEIQRLINVELADANEQIESQKEKIVSSIKYAKRIQDSMLSPISNLNNYLTDAFVLFRPRDIVSGDFYWFNKVDDKFVIAAIDCTGHGVPGAFMTLMGNGLLNNIILKDKITQPDQVLYELDKRLLKNLKKDGESQTNDGMDMTVITIPEDRKKIEFAGAKNPLIIIRDGEMIQIKGSKFPIGSQQFKVPKKFELHSIEVQKGDLFYTYSDGYPDQFGGENNMKYLSKRFKNFLLQISSKAIETQKSELKVELDAWIGDGQQTDDIIVIGFKLD